MTQDQQDQPAARDGLTAAAALIDERRKRRQRALATRAELPLPERVRLLVEQAIADVEDQAVDGADFERDDVALIRDLAHALNALDQVQARQPVPMPAGPSEAERRATAYADRLTTIERLAGAVIDAAREVPGAYWDTRQRTGALGDLGRAIEALGRELDR